MSDTILGGDFRVYYASENNQKRVEWTGAVTGTRSTNELYSALQKLFDDPAQMDDLVPMKADTPDIYRFQNQWFIDDVTVEHLTAGSIFSDKWKDGTTEHVLLVGYAQTTEFETVDIGRTIVGTISGDTGTILDFNTLRNIVTIRPVDPAAAGDEFDDGTESYTIQNDPFDQVWQVDAPSTFVDETADANSAANADWLIFPGTETTTDYVALGYSQQFSKVLFDNLNGTQGVGGVVVWEYWNGTTWSTLAGVTDGTSGFTTAVADGQALTYTVPTDWATQALNGSALLYYIRARITTVYSTNPVYDQGFITGVGAGAFSIHGRHGSASKAGESAWVGITTIGTIEPNTHIYISQENPDIAADTFDEVLVTASKATTDWWKDGQIDILLKVKEADSVFGQQPASSPATAVSTTLARQYSKSYSHFIATALATSGGNTVVPLSTADDLDNTTGNRQITAQSATGTGTFVLDEVIEVVGTDKQGIVTLVAGTSGDPILDYYLFGDPLTDFANGDAVVGVTSTATMTSQAPVNVGPASDTDITFTHAAFLRDINEDGTTNPYSIDLLNASSKTMALAYERTKHLTRRGESATASTDGQEGQFYIGSELQIEYSSQTGGEYTEGTRVYDQTSDAVGVIVADHPNGALGDLILRSVRGTFTSAVSASDSPDPTQQFNTPAGNGRCWTFDDSAGTFVDESADADSAAAGDVILFGDSPDIVYFGVPKVFAKLVVDVGTAGTVGVGLWEYWNGTAWTDLEAVAGFVDGTTDLTVIGINNVTFPPPISWRPTSVNGSPVLYFVRHRVTTNYSVVPILDQILVEDNVIATIDSLRTIAPVTTSPFGTFPGASKFFMAPGLAPTPAQMAAGEAQKFSTIDDDGVTRAPPNKQDVEVSNLISGDTVTVLRRTGTSINKTQFTLTSGPDNIKGGTVVVVSVSVPADNPGVAGSKVRVISPSGEEHRYRYASFSSASFTLDVAKTGTADAGSSDTQLTDAAGAFTTAPSVEVGDYVRNTTDDVFRRVVTVDSATQLTIEAGISFATSDNYSINTLVENYGAISAYVPSIERIANAVSEKSSLTFLSTFDIRVDVRRTSASAILPFAQDSSFILTGRSIAAVRTPDDIIT